LRDTLFYTLFERKFLKRRMQILLSVEIYIVIFLMQLGSVLPVLFEIYFVKKSFQRGRKSFSN